MFNVEGKTVEEISTDFGNAVESYLTSCEKHGKQPNRTYSDKILLRIYSMLHAQLALRAQAQGMSIEQYPA